MSDPKPTPMILGLLMGMTGLSLDDLIDEVKGTPEENEAKHFENLQKVNKHIGADDDR